MVRRSFHDALEVVVGGDMRLLAPALEVGFDDLLQVGYAPNRLMQPLLSCVRSLLQYQRSMCER